MLNNLDSPTDLYLSTQTCRHAHKHWKWILFSLIQIMITMCAQPWCTNELSRSMGIELRNFGVMWLIFWRWATLSWTDKWGVHRWLSDNAMSAQDMKCTQTLQFQKFPNTVFTCKVLTVINSTCTFCGATLKARTVMCVPWIWKDNSKVFECGKQSDFAREIAQFLW